MARNINIEEVLFPVEQKEIYLEGQKLPVSGYKANIGKFTENTETVFSIVSNEYRLVTNEEALEMGEKIYKKLFPDTNNSFEIFNVISPKSKSFCHIDIIDKNYTVNILKKELYIPFIRVHNSYNKSRSLKFDIGFCRKLCDNGMIFEENTVNLKFSHTKKDISLAGIENIDVSHLKKLEAEFIEKTSQSDKIVLSKKYFIPLAAKILGKTFDTSKLTQKRKKKVEVEKVAFIEDINKYATKYIDTESLSETAYAFFNVLTDYASNNEKVNANNKNGLQTKCGEWIKQLTEMAGKAGFNWDNEIKDYEYLIPKTQDN